MKMHFQYNKEKDIWCLLNKGKNSNNSQNPTKQYEQLVASFGENPTEESASSFIKKYVGDNDIDVEQYIAKYEHDWNIVSDEYQKRAETVFGASLPNNVTGYLTINSRCPLSIEGSYFFVTVPTKLSNRTVMHELWHFYTWYGFGADQEQRLGKEKYNDVKEALTALLNLECKDLLPEGSSDVGYHQHRELRQKIVEFWKREKDINKLWAHFTQEITHSDEYQP